MSMLKDYKDSVSKTLRAGFSTEHSFRPALKRFLEVLFNNVVALNEPKRSKAGAPDFVILKNNVPVGYIETKDVGISLDVVEESEQIQRYLEGFENFILTNYLEFRWYVNGEIRLSTGLGILVKGNSINYIDNREIEVLELINSFMEHQTKTVNTAKELAMRMANLSKLCNRAVLNILKEDRDDSSNISHQYEMIKSALLHNLTIEQFSDMLAQTISYGLFAARINQKESKNDLTRMTAVYVIPKTNPFLRELFGNVVGPAIDENLIWIVDDIVRLLKHTDVESIVREFQGDFGKEDPILHFYETFLEYYKPEERIKRGVYYTPEPVIDYIVNSVDVILKNNFKMKDGLADTSRTKANFHKVQILDPALGTGAFLDKVIDHIYDHYSKSGSAGKGLWSGYVGAQLLPRLKGFELLMSPYTIAHMKLGMKLKQTGFTFEDNSRLRVFLTNTLDKPKDASDYSILSLLANYLSGEAEAADNIKRDSPIMVILGNPPYNSESVNDIEFINKLMRGWDDINEVKTENYFTLDDEPLGERNTKWLNDDYVKFIRFSQWKIEQTGYGVLAFITPHGFLDNPTFRGMRKSLLNTFDDIYILDLHGNANKQEGRNQRDENVFDIATGTSITFFIKVQEKRKTVRVYHKDLWGTRNDKYKHLENNNIKSTEWTKINPIEPFYFFVPQDLKHIDEYNLGISITNAMPEYSNGIVTARDHFTIKYNQEDILEIIEDFSSLPPEEARNKYELGRDTRDWKVHLAQEDLNENHLNEENITRIYYRPFDWRYTYYTGKSKGFLCMPRKKIMDNFINKENLAILTSRLTKGETFKHLIVTDTISEAIALSSKSSNNAFSFPLYIFEEGKRTVNFSEDFLKLVEKKTTLKYNGINKGNGFTDYDLFSYIVAILSTPSYGGRYSEYLKTDFPKIPITSKKELFLKLIQIGKEIIELHLFKSDINIKTPYPIEGNNKVTKFKYNETKEKLYINDTQYFSNVKPEIWKFEIGGYQVIKKWSSYREGNILTYNDLTHMQKIISTIEKLIDAQYRLDEVIQDLNEGFPLG